MQYIPVKTDILHPPKDDLWKLFDTFLPLVHEKDIVIVTSKIVSIGEGRCVLIGSEEKGKMVEKEAEYTLVVEGRHPLTIVHHALISGAGIDESNGDGYYTLLPEDPYRSAKEVWNYLRERFGLEEVGVIITDSHSLPLRYGAMSVSIGFFGFLPVERHVGKPDLFGKLMKYSSTNLADALSAGATLVSGECDECQPIVIARGVPSVRFTDIDTKDAFLVSIEEDIYQPLLKEFTKSDRV